MWQIFTITLRAFIKKFYDFLMFKKVIKMYKNYKEILKHNFGCCRAWTNHHLITCLTPWTTWPHSLAPQRRENSLNMLLWKLPSKFVEIQAKTLVLTDANLNLDNFWQLSLDLQRVLIKDRFHNFYKLLPISSILTSYQNLLETDNNYD